MKMKTSELTARALDWAVAKCEEPVGGYKSWVQKDLDNGILHGMKYSTDWLWGGPIIEREYIQLNIDLAWVATRIEGSSVSEERGATPLIAAMRCYVASKLGDEIDVPDELK